MKSFSQKKTIWGLYLISPFWALLESLRSSGLVGNKSLFIAVGVFYGIVFVPIPNSDATRIIINVESNKDYALQDYLTDITSILTVDANYKDVYFPSLIFVTSFLGGGILLFKSIVALIYFYFLVSLLEAVYIDLQLSSYRSRILSVFFLFIVFIMPLSAGVNAVRWPTALIFLLYNSYKLATTYQIKYLFYACLAPLFHFAILPSLAALFF